MSVIAKCSLGLNDLDTVRKLSILQEFRKDKNYEKVSFSGHNGFDGHAGFGSAHDEFNQAGKVDANWVINGADRSG